MLTRIFYINALSGLAFLMFYPLYKNRLADWLISNNVSILNMATNPLPGISGNFDIFGLINVGIFFIFTLILNTIFFANEQKLLPKRFLYSTIAMAFSLVIFTFFVLFLGEFIYVEDTTVETIVNFNYLYERNDSSMLPIIYVFVWLDYLLSFNYVKEKEEKVIQ